MLGFGATGEVWAGRDEATGEAVALKRLRTGTGPGERERLRREATVLAGFRHPHVVGLRGVLGTGEGLVLVLDLAEEGSLTGLLAARGRLGAEEAVTLLAPVADALAAAHAAGIVHADVAPGNVLLGAGRHPLLADLGTARLVGDRAAEVHGTAGYLDPAVLAGGDPGPASDVYALGAVAVHALTGRPVQDDEPDLGGVAPALAAVLRSATASEPDRRPTAGELARMLRDALAGSDEDPITRRVRRGGAVEVAPAPAGWWGGLRARTVGWRGAAGGVRRRPGGGRRHGRPARLPTPGAGGPGRSRVVLVVGVLAVAVAGGAGWAAADRVGGASAVPAVPPVPAAASRSAAAGWAAVLDGLDARRSEAFARADAGLLDAVYTPRAPARLVDAEAVRSLAAAGARATGVRHELRSARPAAGTGAGPGAGDRATLVVTDRMSAYRVVGPGGRVLRAVPARGDRTFRVEVQRTTEGWRIAAVAPGTG